nr:hypothetical protein FQY85_15450 [Cronobacter turicensis]
MLSGHKFLALSGFSLIAAACGLARFSWGLQLPDVIRDIPVLGIFGTLALLALCLPAEQTPARDPDICSRKRTARR